jgi:hypothetical protein
VSIATIFLNKDRKENTMGMSISSSSTTNTMLSQPMRSDWKTLTQALQAGDLTGAQKAFATLQADRQNGLQSNPASSISTDLTALGQALTSGDLTGAQKAFTTLRSDIQVLRQKRGGGRGKKHDNDGDDVGGAAPDRAPAAATSSTSSSPNGGAAKTVVSEATSTNADGTLTRNPRQFLLPAIEI